MSFPNWLVAHSTAACIKKSETQGDGNWWKPKASQMLRKIIQTCESVAFDDDNVLAKYSPGWFQDWPRDDNKMTMDVIKQRFPNSSN